MYQKPMIFKTEDLAEGVYAASGSTSCYTVTAHIHQVPQTGRGDYRIQVNANHHADHTKDSQVLTITFNQPVTLINGGGTGGKLVSGDGTTTLKIQYFYHVNPSENIGFGDLTVQSDPGLAITGTSMTD